MERKQSQGGFARGLSYSVVDAITAAVVIIIGIVMMVDNQRIGITWAVDGPKSG